MAVLEAATRQVSGDKDEPHSLTVIVASGRTESIKTVRAVPEDRLLAASVAKKDMVEVPCRRLVKFKIQVPVLVTEAVTEEKPWLMTALASAVPLKEMLVEVEI